MWLPIVRCQVLPTATFTPAIAHDEARWCIVSRPGGVRERRIDMKIGTLTFHRALNYGAVLQAYALQHVLRDLGAECEVIDYRCEALERPYAICHMHDHTLKGVLSAILHLPRRIGRRVRFAGFLHKHMELSSTAYTRETVVRASTVYDRIIAGSDQVWNVDLTGGDTTYFLDFVKSPRMKTSYAASLGGQRSADSHAEMYRAMLKDFGAISVRENESAKYLQQLLERDVTWVLDPVLLCDRAALEAIATPPPVKFPYIFAYCLHETDMYRYVRHLQETTGLKVVYVPESLRTRIDGKRVVTLSPSEFLGYISNAAIVVSDSYHAIALSVAFGGNFRVQLKKALPELNSRLTSLLSLLQLDDCVISAADYEDVGLKTVHYGQASIALEAARVQSRAFLERLLAEECGDE